MEFQPISSGALRFVVSTTGEGPDIVLLHGFPDTPYGWSETASALADDGWRVSVPWLRGYHPETIVPGRPYDPETIGKDALGLLDALGAADAVLVGHDWGALIAYAAAALAPERIRAIVTIAIPHPSRLPRTPGAFWSGRHILRLKFPGAAALCRRNDFAYLDALYRRWAPDWSGPERDETLRRARQALADDATLEAAITYYRDLPLLPARLFSRIPRVPGLVIGSNHDLFGGHEPYTETAARLAAPNRALIVDGAGHWPHRERPGEVLPELLRFLREVR